MRAGVGISAFATILGVCLCAAPGAAHAGAWTPPRGEGLILLGYGVHSLDAAGLPGRLEKSELSVYGELGAGRGIALVGRIGLQSLSDSREDAGGEILASRGTGGNELGLRYNVVQEGRWAVSSQVLATFATGGESRNNTAFGDRGGDLDSRLMIGRSIGRSSFAEAQGGWRERRDLGGGELRFDTAFGWRPRERLQLIVQTYSVWSQANPPGGDYSGHRAQLSASVDGPAGVTLTAAVLGTVSSRRMARERAVLMSVGRRF